MLRQPARSLVIGIEARDPLVFRSLLRAAMGQAMLQTFASSFSFCASAMTF
jgi:hypothetical protein